jgi:hypothetical protein
MTSIIIAAAAIVAYLLTHKTRDRNSWWVWLGHYSPAPSSLADTSVGIVACTYRGIRIAGSMQDIVGAAVANGYSVFVHNRFSEPTPEEASAQGRNKIALRLDGKAPSDDYWLLFKGGEALPPKTNF